MYSEKIIRFYLTSAEKQNLDKALDTIVEFEHFVHYSDNGELAATFTEAVNDLVTAYKRLNIKVSDEYVPLTELK